MTKRAIGYIRVSDVGGRAGPGYHTLEIQRASIERVCRARGYELVDVVTEENLSGRSRAVRRLFLDILDRVLDGEAEAVAVWKVSRFSRSWAEAGQDTEALLDADKDLLSEEGFDTTTAGGRLLMRILFSLAEWEHDVLGEHWETIKDKAVRDRGSWLGVPPLGYRSGRGGVLEPSEQASHVVELFKARAAGQPWGDLAERLDAIRPRPGGTRHEAKDARRIIQSRAYLGEARWRGQVNTEAHEPIVSPELWQAANHAASDTPRQQRRERLREFPLTGWLRCSGCGGPMSGSTMVGGDGRKRGNYICSRRHGGCERPVSISATIAEAWALSESERLQARFRVEVVADDGPDAEDLRRRAEVESALHELASVDARRDLGEDWLPMMRRLRAEKAEIETRTAARSTAHPTSREDMNESNRWAQLRDIAPSGALVGPAIGRGRHSRAVDRLSIIDDSEADSVLST